MPDVVQRDPRQAGPAGVLSEPVREPGGVDLAPVRPGEDQVRGRPRGADRLQFLLTLPDVLA
jgi:hypothetical protein